MMLKGFFKRKFLVCAMIGFSLASGFAVKADKEFVDFGIQATDKEPWRKDVRFVLSDSESANSECEKKIKIFGLPSEVVVDCVRVWTNNCSMSGSSCFIDKEEVVYNVDENSCEVVFEPCLDSKCLGCENLVSPECMLNFKVMVFLKDKTTGEAIDSIGVKLSNEGLKKPTHLNDFKNFKIDFVKGSSEDEVKILVHGLPENVSKMVSVKVEQEVSSEGNKEQQSCWECLYDGEVARNENGVFEFGCFKLKAGSDKYIEIRFEDDEGYKYLITDKLKNFDSGVLNKDFWRENVKFVLSDSESANSKCEKRIKIFGLPNWVDVNWVRIWPKGCSMLSSSSSVDLKYDLNENFYEFVFKPRLMSNRENCENLASPECMSAFDALVFLKDKATGEPIEPLEVEISNQGSKRPAHLDDFKNFKLDFVKDLVTGGGGKILIYGVPENVSKIQSIAIQQDVNARGSKKENSQPWERLLDENELSRNENGVFEVSCSKLKAGHDRCVDIRFEDDDGYEYLITDGLESFDAGILGAESLQEDVKPRLPGSGFAELKDENKNSGLELSEAVAVN